MITPLIKYILIGSAIILVVLLRAGGYLASPLEPDTAVALSPKSDEAVVPGAPNDVTG